MLLALRRWLSLSTPVVQEADGVIDRKAQKWVIEPARVGLVARAEELWRYRRILWFFASRRIKERYEDKTLGRFWMFFQPLAPILISTLIFGNMLQVPSDGLPYFLFILTGMSCWRIFERGVQRVTRSLDQNRALIKKVYFPRLIAPISSVAPALTEFGVLFTLLVATCIYYYFKDGVFYLRLGPQILVAFLAIAMAAFLSISVGLWTTVMQTRHKDVQFSIRYFMQLWYYVTPVIFPLSELLKVLPSQLHFVAYLNPMSPVVEMYKWGVLGIGHVSTVSVVTGVAMMLAIFSGGVVYFNRSEAASVDRL
jgi:homopolymeric O-antigen transport system permease protein